MNSQQPTDGSCERADAQVLLICNPAAGGRWKDLAAVLDSDEAKHVRRVVTDSVDDLRPALAEMSRRTRLICIYGGDGTVQRVIAAMGLYGDEGPPTPSFAFIGGGTMNVAAGWCGLTGPPHRNFREVIRHYRAGELATREVPLMRVADGDATHHGFTVGFGPMVRILADYERGRKGKLAAVAHAARGLWATWARPPGETGLLVERMRARVDIDGERVPYENFAAVFCSTTGLINPSVTPFVHTRTPTTFYCLAYAVSGRELTLALPLLWRGFLPIDLHGLLKPISTWRKIVLSYFGRELIPADPRYVNSTAERVRISTDEDVYTIDGEIMRPRDRTLDLSLGPTLRLAVSPTAGLGPFLRVVTNLARKVPSRSRAEQRSE